MPQENNCNLDLCVIIGGKISTCLETSIRPTRIAKNLLDTFAFRYFEPP